VALMITREAQAAEGVKKTQADVDALQNRNQ